MTPVAIISAVVVLAVALLIFAPRKKGRHASGGWLDFDFSDWGSDCDSDSDSGGCDSD